MPLPPTNLIATVTGPSSIGLGWSVPGGSIGSNVLIPGVNTNRGPLNQWPGESLEPIYVYVIPGRTYEYVDGAHEFGLSIPGPDIPDGATAYFIAEDNYVTFAAWEPNSSFTATLKQVSYRSFRIYRDGAVIGEVPGSILAFTDTGRTTLQRYAYKIEGVALDGTSAGFSSVVYGVLPGIIPWVRVTSAPGDYTVNATALTTDLAGNNIMAGFCSGTPDFGGGPLNITEVLSLFVAKYKPDGLYLWAKQFPCSPTFGVTGVKADALGNVVMCGYFNGTINFGGTALVNNGHSTCFLAKFDSNGNHLWSKKFAGVNGSDRFEDIAIDSDKNIIAVGQFTSTASFGGATFGSLYTGAHAIMAKYDPSGNHLWSKSFADTGENVVLGVAIWGYGSDDKIVITGWFTGTINMTDDASGDYLTSRFSDVFLARFTASGHHEWSKAFRGDDVDKGQKVVVDSAGNIVITGIYLNGINFGPGAIVAKRGSSDIFLAKFDQLGVHIWSQALGGGSIDEVFGLAIDTADNIVVSGYFYVKADFGPSNFGGHPTIIHIEPAAGGGNNGFVAKYNPNGFVFWAEFIGGSGVDVVAAVATDPSGNVIAAGTFQGVAVAGSLPMRAASGQYATFLYKRGP